MAIQMPKLEMPKLALPALDRKTTLMAVGGVVVLAAAGWFGWQNMMSEPPPKPTPVAQKEPPEPAPKPAAPAPAPVAAAPMASAAKPAEPAAMPAMPAMPEAKAKPASAPRSHSRAGEDARECLKQPTDALIAHCAEQYR